ASTPSATLTGLIIPHVLTVDAAGNLYVDRNSAVCEFAPGATTPTVFFSNLGSRVTALAVDTAGTLYVAVQGNNTVAKYARGSTTPTGYISGLSIPLAFAFDPDGNLYVINQGGQSGNSVAKVAPGASVPTAILTGLNKPASLVCDSLGN